MDLMHDDVISLKFIPSLVYTKFFSSLCHLLVVSTRLFFVSLVLLKFTSPHFESEAWGEIVHSHVNTNTVRAIMSALSTFSTMQPSQVGGDLEMTLKTS